MNGGLEQVNQTVNAQMFEEEKKKGKTDDDFESNNRAMYRGVFAVPALVLPMPC